MRSVFLCPCVSLTGLQTFPVLMTQNVASFNQHICVHVVTQAFMCTNFSKSVQSFINSAKSWFTQVFNDVDFKRQISVSKERTNKRRTGGKKVQVTRKEKGARPR